MIPRRRCDDAATPFLRAQGVELIEGAANLERSRVLQIFQLEIDLRAGETAQKAGILAWGETYGATNRLPRCLNVFEREHHFLVITSIHLIDGTHHNGSRRVRSRTDSVQETHLRGCEYNRCAV